MWKNNAQNIAYIGRMTRPELYKPLTIDFAGAIDDYYNTKNAAQQNRREEERLQAEKDAREQMKQKRRDTIGDYLFYQY